MSSIESTRTRFFPKSKNDRTVKRSGLERQHLKRNDRMRKMELDQLQDARIDIPKSVKDFGRIKKVVDVAPEVDRSEKIARLRQEIESGQYQIDYEQLADKIISQEF